MHTNNVKKLGETSQKEALDTGLGKVVGDTKESIDEIILSDMISVGFKKGKKVYIVGGKIYDQVLGLKDNGHSLFIKALIDGREIYINSLDGKEIDIEK